MKILIDAKEASTPAGGIVTIYEYGEGLGEVGSSNDLDLPEFNRFELASGRKLTMVGHGEYRADQTGDVFLVKGETLPLTAT